MPILYWGKFSHVLEGIYYFASLHILLHSSSLSLLSFFPNTMVKSCLGSPENIDKGCK